MTAGMLNCGASGEIAAVTTIPKEQQGLWLLFELS
jgi:hypothetical protein